MVAYAHELANNNYKRKCSTWGLGGTYLHYIKIYSGHCGYLVDNHNRGHDIIVVYCFKSSGVVRVYTI